MSHFPEKGHGWWTFLTFIKSKLETIRKKKEQIAKALTC